jgi:predicted permease
MNPDVFVFSFNAIAPMLFTCAVGYIAARVKKPSEETIGYINKVCFSWLLSFHVFNSTMTVDFSAEFNMGLVVYFLAGIAGTVIAAFAVFGIVVKDRVRRANYIIAAYRSSNIVFSLPMATGLFGAAGIKPAAMLIPVTIITFNFLTVVIMVYFSNAENAREKSFAREIRQTLVDIVRNPLIIGSAAGILLSVCRIELPVFLRQSAAMIGSAGTPVSFLLLGMQIDFGKFRREFLPVFGACMLRLAAVPGILVPIMIFSGGFRGPELGALMVVFAAPSAVTNHVMSRIYRLDPDFTGQVVTMSTVLSMATMFVWVTVLRSCGYF